MPHRLAYASALASALLLTSCLFDGGRKRGGDESGDSTRTGDQLTQMFDGAGDGDGLGQWFRGDKPPLGGDGSGDTQPGDGGDSSVDLCEGVLCPNPECRVSECNPVIGQCLDTIAPDGTPCEDGFFCTTDDTCVSGVCQPTWPSSCRFYVDPSATGLNDGSSWDNAFVDPRDAFEYNLFNPTGLVSKVVWIREGTYDIAGQPFDAVGDLVSILGGFLGAENSGLDRPTGGPPTIIRDTAPTGRLLGVYALTETLLDSLVFEDGGYVEINANNILIQRTTFRRLSGLALAIQGRTRIMEASFSDNDVDWVIEGDTFGALSLVRTRFHGNIVNDALIGAVYYLMTDSLLDSNSFTHAGGGYVIGLGGLQIANTTIVNNTSLATLFVNSGNTIFVNSVIWGNTAAGIIDVGTPQVIVHNSIIQGGWAGPGQGALNQDPLFQDADGPDDIPGTPDDDYSLSVASPGIDYCDATAVIPDDSNDVDFDSVTWNDMIEMVTDIDGNPRRVDRTDVVDTGTGTAPLCDLGAYELQQ